MGIIKDIGAFMSGVSKNALSYVRPSIGFRGAFDAGSMDRRMGNWNPRIGQVDNESLDSRDKIVARARDLVRNNPIISGGVERRTETVVGARIRLRAMPDYEAMGETFEWAAKWSRLTEAQFRVWDRDSRKLCDAERTQSFGGMVNTAYRHWWVDGEALAYVETRDRGSAYTTCLRLIDPDRLMNPLGSSDNSRLVTGNTVVGGVEIDKSGVAVAYHVRISHPDVYAPGTIGNETIRIEREDPDGRPRMIHAFRRNRAEQRRGISRLTASMAKIKMLDRYDDAELERSLMRAILAAKVTTTASNEDIAAAIAPTATQGVSNWSVEQNMEYREQNPLLLQGVQMMNLLPNEDVKFLSADGPPPHYPEFRAEGLRSIASDFGLSHQQLSQNWEDINYSSARTLLNEIWRGLLDDRWLFTQDFATPVYAAWLQEAVAIGKVELPGGPSNFYKFRAEITMAEWLGPGRGRIDPKKEADASDSNLAAGRTNLTIEANEQGLDSRDILLGRARDREMIKELGLEDMVAARPETKGALENSTEAEGDAKGTKDDRDGDGVPNEADKRESGDDTDTDEPEGVVN